MSKKRLIATCAILSVSLFLLLSCANPAEGSVCKDGTSCNCGVQDALRIVVNVPASTSDSTSLHRLRFVITPLPSVSILTLSTVFKITPPGGSAFTLTLDNPIFEDIYLNTWYGRLHRSLNVLYIDVASYSPPSPAGPENDNEFPLSALSSSTASTWDIEISNISTCSMSGINATVESWNFDGMANPKWSNSRLSSTPVNQFATITNNPCNQ